MNYKGVIGKTIYNTTLDELSSVIENTSFNTALDECCIKGCLFYYTW
jgi:hypothetical protein